MSWHLEPRHQELLRDEAERFAPAFSAPARREPYLALRRAIEAGEITDELGSAFSELLKLSIESGAVRHFHGPAGEQTAFTLFRTTPRGQAIDQAVANTNEALRALVGERIEGLSIALVRPGLLRLAIEAGGCQLELELDRNGPHPRSVTVER